MIASICSEPSVLKIMRIVNIFISIIRIVVPILLIFVLVFKLISAVTSNDNDVLAKVKKTIPSNIIAAVIIFLIPSLISIIVKITFPNNDYINCIKIKSIAEINEVYESRMEELVKKAEETLNINDYNNAMSYLSNIKDEIKKSYYIERLKIVKEKIDESNNANGGNIYSKVDYSSFKWTYYNKNSGPLTNYESNINPYAIWAPEDINDLNGVSLPLIIWLHGIGEKSGGCREKCFLNSGLLTVMSHWNDFNLEPVPAIIVAPQSYGWWGGYSNNHTTIKALYNYTKDYYNIDESKVVLMGHSMGGNGVIEIAWEMKSLNFYAVVPMSTRVTSYASSKGGKEYYSKIKFKGYGEFYEHQKFYNWIGQPNNYTYYKGESHGVVPKRAMIEDLDNNGVSDLIEWLFYNE